LRIRFRPFARTALAAGVALFLPAWGSASEREIARSAFLGDCSRLEPGKGEQPSLVYIDPAADFFSYVRVLVDPVSVWHGRGSPAASVPVPELRELAARFESAIRTRMQASIFEVVDEPRPAALRVRVALTEAGRAEMKLDLSGAPAANVLTTGTLHADTLAFLRRGAIEIEVVDATTNERLAAAIDARLVAAAGEPDAAVARLVGDTVSWADAEAFLDDRAGRLAAALSALHQLDDPDPPTEPAERK
jgi:hypothetical protein